MSKKTSGETLNKMTNLVGNYADDHVEGGTSVKVNSGQFIRNITQRTDNHTKKASANTWIVIHNMEGAETAAQCVKYFENGAGGRKVSTHYCVDDKEIIHYLEDTWSGAHTGPQKAGQYAADKGCSNANAIGIEMCDHASCNKDKSLELTIELSRYLMKKYNIPVENVVQHFDISGKDCPSYIRKNNKWDYFKQQCHLRNFEDVPINFDPGSVQEVNQGGISSGGSSFNFDNRENWTTIEEVKGVTLSFNPDINRWSIDRHAEFFGKYNIKNEYHYLCDSSKFQDGKQKTDIAFAFTDNDSHTYIDRALYGNKAPKYTLSVGIFCSMGLTDYTVTEKKLIDNVAAVLHENGLNPNHLWREFDLNRAPSPLMYLDRVQWKKFLREVDKQVDWRYQNFGEVAPPKLGEGTKFKDHMAQILPSECPVKEAAREQSNTIKTLTPSDLVKITDYVTGWYRVETPNGWIRSEFLKVIIPPPTGDGAPTFFSQERADNGIKQPEITPTMTHEEFEKYMTYGIPTLIDTYAASQEPYDKGLEEIIHSEVTDDDRLAALNLTMTTKNEVTLNYAVVEATTGDTDHCVTPTSELNIIYKPDDIKVEPIYPDLVIPPNYSTSDMNIKDENRISIAAINEALDKEEGATEAANKMFSEGYTFDYNLLVEQVKESKGKPINYNDPYPYDDKIYELEAHNPKVKIDEIENRMYSCNHPGCPVAQPMAKNFAALNNATISQSVKTEQRLVKIENTLATIMRNVGRLASRVNINCVYYGGQDVISGKYKSIRCLDDTRIHDGASVTIDQCLCCTRYEPIIGQIYEIMDESGINGSTLLDDMQMSYMDSDDMINFNSLEKRNPYYEYADVTEELVNKPEDYIEKWKSQDKAAHIEKIKEKTTDEKELEKLIADIPEEEYIFKMNWVEEPLEHQEPDVKKYPNEGLKAKYKYEIGDAPQEPKGEVADAPISVDIDREIDAEYDKDKTNEEKIVSGEWVDTREKADTEKENKYSSEDFFFDGFATSVNGASGGGAGVGVIGCEARNKIVSLAKTIVQECIDLKACYSMNFRTTKYNDPKYGSDSRYGGKVKGYDCSSMSACCYNEAGLTPLNGKTAMDQYNECKNNGKVWKIEPGNISESLKDALPGDLILTPRAGTPNSPSAFHVAIYAGDEKVYHACTNQCKAGKDIREQSIQEFMTYFGILGKEAGTPKYVGRPKALIEADEKAATSGVGNAATVAPGSGKVTAKKTNWINICLPEAQRAYREHGLFASLFIAQGAEESGWGTEGVAAACNNCFGIKAHGGWTGPVYVSSSGKWRKYASKEESCRDRTKFLLENQRYTTNGVFTAKTWRDQLEALIKAGYIQADQADRYRVNVSNLIVANNFEQYDKK